MDPQDPKPEAERVPAAPQKKQPYTPPVVREEGNIEKLTQALGGAGPDALSGSTV